MMLKSKSSQSKSSPWKLLRAALAGLTVVVGGGALTAGCLDRPVVQAVPRTSNVYVDEIRQTSVDKIDLLFMIDNSISMADKQAILAEAVPLLMQRLITPICVRPCTEANCTDQQKKDGVPVNANAPNCPAGSSPEFPPIKDIHVGVITSSMGAHGAAGSKDVCQLPSDDDHAHLLGDIRNTRDMITPALQPYDANGFLKWDTTNNKYTPPGESNAATFNTKFTDMVRAAGEHGCGFEASLEAWYRFLVDPEPPASIVVAGEKAGPATDAMGQPLLDGTVLAQRKAFLRSDSLVAVVMLSDENDCSIQDAGYGYLIARSGSMYRSTSQCLANPNDKCCQSCGENVARAGCPDIKADSECVKGAALPSGEDSLNLRCWQQKRRFGFDLLYPTRRYSEGLSEHVVQVRSGEFVENPLYATEPGKAPRDTGLVFLAGIVGVPWQDIADEDSLKTTDTLRYLTAAELESQGRWPVILGSPNNETNDAPVLPTDPLMVETTADRTTLGLGPNPITNDALVAASSTNPRANPINGHEQITGEGDLQYACIFPLATPLNCDEAAKAANKGCDCFDDELMANRPLCQPPGGGAPTIKQNFAKAYPGTRHLQVLREFGDNSVVASICPKISTGEGANRPADYGYNPAVKSIIDRLKEALKGKCLPRPLVPNDTEMVQDGLEPGQVPCAVIEAVAPQSGKSCACDAGQNRLALDGSDPNHAAKPELRTAVLEKLKASRTCGQTGQPKCEEYCTCELAQLSGSDLQKCQSDTTPPNIPGYCYINAASNEPQVGNPDLVKDCSADAKRLLRFVGDTPAAGAIALVACLGASLGSQ